MNKWVQFGFYNAIIGLFIGGLSALGATGNGYFIFPIAAPFAAFITGALSWKLINDSPESYSTGRVIIVGFLTGTVSHYFTFILLSVGMNLCYWTTGECTDSLGGPPASILSMLTGSLVFSFFSLLFFGWLTVPLSILIGISMKGNRNNVAQQSA